MIDYDQFDPYEVIIRKTGCHHKNRTTVRAMTIGLTREQPEQWVFASWIAGQIGRTPLLGDRGTCHALSKQSCGPTMRTKSETG
jgi:hypothetical protein